jgi:hypothetical protein
MLRPRVWIFATLAAAVIGSAAFDAPLLAQHDAESFKRFDVALGVSLNGPADVNQRPKCVELALPCTSPKTVPDFGVALQAALHATEHVALVGEASLYGNAWDTVGVDKALTNHVSALLLGPRFVTSLLSFGFGKDTTRYRAFTEVLAGPEASDVVPTRFALQPGAGIDFKLAPEALSVRMAYSYRYTRGAPRNLSGGRILGGVALLLPVAP